MSDKVLLVIINYHSNDFCEKQIDSFKRTADFNHEIVVLNNDSLKNRYDPSSSEVIVIDSEVNLGYFGSLVEVDRHVKLRSFKLIIIGNADLIWTETSGLVLEYHDSIGILAPTIISNDGQLQNPHRFRKPGYRVSFILWLLFSSYIFYKLFALTNRLRRNLLDFNGRAGGNELPEVPIFSAHGACVILTPRFLNAIDSLEMDFFLYGEEDWIAGNCAKHELSIILKQDIVVEHAENVSTSKIANRKKFKMKRDAYFGNKRKFGKFLFKL